MVRQMFTTKQAAPTADVSPPTATVADENGQPLIRLTKPSVRSTSPDCAAQNWSSAIHWYTSG